MKISIIAAIGKHNELGKNNTLLWDLPNDMAHFREKTRGHIIIMGRKTFESIGKPLPGRQNIVITTDPHYSEAGVTVAHSYEEALTRCDFANYPDEVFVIGGAQIYTQALPTADTLYITHVDGEFNADTFFPEIDTTVWKEASRESHSPDQYHQYGYSFGEYKKETL